MEREAAAASVRVQLAMWVGDKWCRCVICGHTYESVDDFMVRNPVHVGRDHRGLMVIADQACFEPMIDEYRAEHPRLRTTNVRKAIG